MFFLRDSGRVGQKVLLELRRRVFSHFQTLDIAFHDRYTSGRVVSRLTNDIDAIEEMLATGFDGLVTAVLTMVGVDSAAGAGLRLGAICLIAFPILMVLVWWFCSESAKTYREVRESAALVIVQFVETMTGIKAVQAYRREPRNQEIFEGLADRYRDVNDEDDPAGRDLHARRPAGRQPHHRRRAALRRLPGAARTDDDRRARRVPALPADVLRADAGDLAVLQHLPVGLGRTGEAVRCAGRAARHPGAGESGEADVGARRRRVPRRALLVRAGPPSAARLEPDGAGRADRRPGRHHRRGQDDHRQADFAVLRPDGRLR